MDDVVFIKDSREPEFAWDAYFQGPTITKCLRTGDYSLEGFENEISLERKSLDDLIGCLGYHRRRFEAELQRAQDMRFFAILVEDSYTALANHCYTSRMHPNSALESVSAFEVRYKTPFHFCGSQPMAARRAESLLRKFRREQMKQIESDDIKFPF